MANLRDEDEEGISLFPMFNILACTLGVMVFILATVATVSLGADKAIEIAEGAPFDPAPDSSRQTIRDAGFGQRDRREPLWVEWTGQALLIYPSLDSVRLEQDMRAMDTWQSTWDYISEALTATRVGNAIAQAALDYENRYVVLLARPSGFDELLEVSSYFEFLGLDVAVEPINQQWQRVRIAEEDEGGR
jgi:hypothetical protein